MEVADIIMGYALSHGPVDMNRNGVQPQPKKGKGGNTYRIANFRGLSESTGKSAKQTMKHAKAARLHPPKIRSRSHRLTVEAVVLAHVGHQNVVGKIVRSDSEASALPTYRQTTLPPPLSL
jgi:hypothetical protein